MTQSVVAVELQDLASHEIAEVLRLDVSACLAFIDAAGYPRQVPCWFYWDGDAFYVTSLADKFHVRRLQSDARASICIEVEQRTSSGRSNRQVKGQGRVEIFSDADGAWSERIRAKYLGEVAFPAGAAAATRVVLRLKPERLVAHGGGIRVA